MTYHSFTGCVLLFRRNLDVVYCFGICSQVQHYTGLTELNHRAYSPDIAASDNHLFSNILRVIMTVDFLEAWKIEMIDEYIESI